MAAHARAFGYCFNPISVFWCWDATGRRAATVVEVHNTYGDRHAYLVHPDEQGRARTPKAMYVSPFHGTDGTYELAVPVPHADRLDIAITLRTDDGDRFSASLSGHRANLTPRRTASAAIRGAALIRMHGMWLWLASPPDPAAPRPRPEGSSDMTVTSARRAANHWPGLDVLPTGPRAWISARIARTLFETAVNRLDVTVHVGDETFGRGGPVMVVSRPEEFYLRLGRDQLIGFGEAYLTGAWDAEDLGWLPHRAGVPGPAPHPRAAPEAALARRAQAPRGRARQRRELAGQHRPPLRPLQRPLRAVPRPDAELLLRAVPARPARRLGRCT